MKYSLLREKNFSILVMSGFISLIGTEMLNFSLSLYVLQITHSATLFSCFSNLYYTYISFGTIWRSYYRLG